MTNFDALKKAIAAMEGSNEKFLKGTFSQVSDKVFPISLEIKNNEILQKKAKGLELEAETASVGEKMSDGTIYVGVYDQFYWFATATDAMVTPRSKCRLEMTYDEAEEYASKLRIGGYSDWILPPGDGEDKKADILGALYDCRNEGSFAGTFSDDPYSWYWAKTNPGEIYELFARERSLSDGEGEVESTRNRSDQGFVRCVRAIPKKS